MEAVIVGDQITSVSVVGRYNAGELEDVIRPGDDGELPVRIIDDATGEVIVDGLVPDPRINMAADPDDVGIDQADVLLADPEGPSGEVLFAIPAPADGGGRLEVDLPTGPVQIAFTVDAAEFDARTETDSLVIAAAPILKRGACPAGASSPAVKRVQNQLVALRYRLGPNEPRGCFSDGTWYAVQAFQRDNGLVSDGEVGPNTRQKLLSPRKITAKHPQAEGIHVEVFQDRGVTRLYRGATLVGTYASSTGAGGGTPNGSYRVKSKETRSWSYSSQIWMPWASYLTGGGLPEHTYALHQAVGGACDGYPADFAACVPDYPASHGCVRLGHPVAKQIFNNTPVGTRVHIMP